MLGLNAGLGPFLEIPTQALVPEALEQGRTVSCNVACYMMSVPVRDHQLVGPISLYLLAVADSGERKTACDAIFCPALRDWESGRRREMFPEIAKLEAATALFAARSPVPCAGAWRERHDSVR